MLLVGRMLDVAPREDLQGRSQNQVDSVTGQLLYFTSPSPNWGNGRNGVWNKGGSEWDGVGRSATQVRLGYGKRVPGKV